MTNLGCGIMQGRNLALNVVNQSVELHREHQEVNSRLKLGHRTQLHHGLVHLGWLVVTPEMEEKHTIITGTGKLFFGSFNFKVNTSESSGVLAVITKL